VNMESRFQRAGFCAAVTCALGMAACQFNYAAAEEPSGAQTTGAQSRGTAPATAGQNNSGSPGLLIENNSPLPDTYPHGRYEFSFHARGGVPTLHWRLEKGALPPGIKLEDNGLLHGEAQRAGEYNFTVSVRDSGSPRQGFEKEFSLRVVEAITLNWKTPAHVTGNRIDGSVEVSNTTADDVDLTFIVAAVAENGRATAIGYQHFPLKKGTTGMELPFGETLPPGAYVVHVDVVGEVAERDAIYRKRMQTPGPLSVTVGP
jgi:hypothetical protein